MRKVHVLVVEDDDANRLLLRRYLGDEGFEVSEAADGPAALRAIHSRVPDVVVLDLGLPGLDGVEVLRQTRRDSGVPVLVLTGRRDEPDKLDGFDAGADDYLVKPVSLPELGARLRALARRGEPKPARERFVSDTLVIDTARAEVVVDGTAVDLTPKELALLGFLAASPGRYYTREELLLHVWGSTGQWQDPATVTEHVRRLRRKLEADPRHPRWITSSRGHGYRFVSDAGAEAEAEAEPEAEESGRGD